MDKEHAYILMEINMSENGKKVNGTEKESLHMPMERLKKVSGKKIN